MRIARWFYIIYYYNISLTSFFLVSYREKGLKVKGLKTYNVHFL